MRNGSGYGALLAAFVSLVACGAVVEVSPVEGNATPAFPRIGVIAPRTAPDPADDQWMIGCEVLDRDFAKFSAYKDYLPKLGIRSIRLQCGWAKCEKEKEIGRAHV